VSFIPDQVFFGSLQVFDEAISKLQQEDQGAHGGYFCSWLPSDKRFCCVSKTYELWAVQADILIE